MSTNMINDMGHIDDVLKQVGLKSHEAACYMYLLKNGTCTITQIAQALKLHRPKAYTVVRGLLKKELVIAQAVGKHTEYQAENPAKLEQKVAQIQNEMSGVAPLLGSWYHTHHGQFNIVEYSGKSGMAQMFLDVPRSLKRGDTFYRYGSERVLELVDGYVPEEYRSKRDTKSLKRLTISNRISGNKKRLRLERDIRFMPEKQGSFDQNIVQFIYADKVSYLDFDSEKGIIIQSKSFSEYQKTIFLSLYYTL